MTSAIAIQGVSVAIGGKQILDRIDLTVDRGEIVGVIGPSGGGKTTLLRVVLGLLAPDAGEVLLDGRSASTGRRILVPPERRDIGVVFQDLALWPHLSVAGNLTFALASRGASRSEQHARAREMLERVGLAGYGSRRPGELSGGERQRVAIARALVVAPRAVLFDEPLANLDPVLRGELGTLLRLLLRERGTTAIYVTHDPRELVGFVDRIAVLEDGEIVQAGSLEQLRQAPSTSFVRAISQY